MKTELTQRMLASLDWMVKHFMWQRQVNLENSESNRLGYGTHVNEINMEMSPELKEAIALRNLLRDEEIEVVQRER